MKPTAEVIRDLLMDIVEHPLPPPKLCLRQEVEGWDSLAHLQLILAVEQEFSVRLPTERLHAVESIDQLAGLVKELQ